MFLRYSCSPSFEGGWSVGVHLISKTEVGTDDHTITEGFIYTKSLKDDAYARAADLSHILPTSLTPAAMEVEDIATFSRLAADISLGPGVYPWASMDGALSAIEVTAGDSTMTAEWNSDHPDSWRGLEALIEFLRQLFTKYN